MRPRVLSLSTVYPHPDDPQLGLFVRARLQHLASSCDVRVLSPVPTIDWFALRGQGETGRRRPSGWTQDGALQVACPRWFYPPGGGPAAGFLLARQLTGKIRRLRAGFAFDMVDAHFGYPEGVAAAVLARRFSVPFVVTLRGSEVMHARQFLRRAVMRWALRQADRVIAVSRRLAEFAADLGVSAERLRVIGNGVDRTVFRLRDQVACKRKHGLAPATRLVLSVGHLIELKGHHLVIRALAELPDEVHLWIVGGAGRAGYFEPHLRSLVKDLHLEDRVRFCGSVPPETVAELMAAAGLLCLASSREGWPNVVHEALSCGTPVVATDVGAVTDILGDERHGIVVPAGDQASLTEALKAAVGREWDREAIAAWGQARGWDQVAGEVLEEIRAVIRG